MGACKVFSEAELDQRNDDQNFAEQHGARSASANVDAARMPLPRGRLQRAESDAAETLKVQLEPSMIYIVRFLASTSMVERYLR